VLVCSIFPKIGVFLRPRFCSILLGVRSNHKIREAKGKMAKLEFRSPVRKLVVFFKSSRDKWKKKCQDAKYELKLLKRRIQNLQASCDQWQQCHQAAEVQCAQVQARNEHLQARQEQLQAELDLFSKKGRPIS
jgi:chromosome segregation ATPase